MAAIIGRRKPEIEGIFLVALPAMPDCLGHAALSGIADRPALSEA